MVASISRSYVPVKIEVKTEPDDYNDPSYFNFHTKEEPPELHATASAAAEKPRKRIPGPSRGPVKHSAPKPILHVNRRRLSSLLRDLARAHNWKEASGVLSALLRGTPRASIAAEDRRNFLVAMELQKRFGVGNYQKAIKQIFDTWTSKLAWTRKCEKKMNAIAFYPLRLDFFPSLGEPWRVLLPGYMSLNRVTKKKHSIQLELALFHISQGNVAEAHNATKFLFQDGDSANEPTVNLIHGLILYQLWYSELLKELPRKGFNICMSLETNGMPIDNDNEEPEMIESSNDHNAVDIEDAKFCSQYASESSVGNNKKVLINCKNNVPKNQFRAYFPAQGFYMTRSADMNEEGAGSPIHDNNFLDSSIFLADGLDSCLLPIRLKHSTGNLEQLIYSYRRFANEQYRDALRHLRLALYSTPPLLAALLPLIQVMPRQDSSVLWIKLKSKDYLSQISACVLNACVMIRGFMPECQLLLLGDRVEEALKELEHFCTNSNMALPFRLRARLLEVFHSNQTTMISSCYENVLKRDPTCDNSLERLIRMHRTGNYSSMLLLEMIASHLDAASGNCRIWGEFASCFLKLLNATVSEYEDRISANVRRGQTDLISSRKVPKALTEGHARDVWRLRCRWWVTRHFSNNAYLSEMQAGDWKLLSSKAACASHLYGPRFEYVISVLRSLRKEGGSSTDHISFLCLHMQNSIKLYENLD